MVNSFGSISWHIIWFLGSFTVFAIFSLDFELFWPEYQDTYVIEMRIWCIKIGIVLVLHLSDSDTSVKFEYLLVHED
jgi:hypothetical protein